ncbi:MAG TPA: ATP-binding cassette domain-containing protein [Ilumatobacteraceae bacterium]|nr:ATP-binding cassette domain-containing protein [Ilumatobacteraceae bacterium]
MYDQEPRHTISPAAAPASNGGITATGLGKCYGDLWALRGLDLRVEPGTVLGLLGHNGAGKTTAIRILTTLSMPTEGSATVAGLDVVRHAAAVRKRIGVASQQSTVDGLMNARLNLQTIGRLHGMSKAAARQRTDELLERLDLTDFASALVKTFSGGMRRRLDLAASLMGDPDVLFLDEPTTGLDPRSRGDLWQMLTDLVRNGTTIILTTQYLEEADRMADDIIVLDHGRTVAHGTPADLKTQIGDDRLDVKVAAHGELVAAASALAEFADNDPTFDSDELIVTAPIKEGVRVIDVVRALDEAGIEAVDITRREATLDDVFLTLTSRHHERERSDERSVSA